MSLEEFAGAVVTSVPLPLSADPVPFLWTNVRMKVYLVLNFGVFEFALVGIWVRIVQLHYQFSPSGPQICLFPHYQIFTNFEKRYGFGRKRIGA